MLSFLPISVLLAQGPQLVHIDPLLLVEANEIWSIIGSSKNPVWPGWDAKKTPVLIYFPGKQEILVNHPNPPAGFVKYTGALASPIGSIYIRNGKTTFDLDGQNTSTEINGVETLVVADTNSTRRQWIASIANSVVKEPSKANETIEGGLFSNPFDSMTMFAHEAFHVYQRHMAPKKAGNELALTKYPTLSVNNNIWLALEADYLAATVAAKTPEEARKEGIRWLAARQARWAQLSKESQDYENGTEFSEGLAKYVEYKTLQCLQGRKPAPEMWLVSGFPGYGDLSVERDRLIRSMKGFMSGQRLVNNDPYGASPVRFRMYYSGMAIGALLDRLGSRWHDRVLKTDASLTSLAAEALHASPTEISEATKQAEASERYASLKADKEKLAKDGAIHIQEEVAKFSSGPGELVLDYSGIKSPKVGFSFTPFGILSVDDDRTIYRLIPIRGLVGALSFSEDSARPILHDRKGMLVRLQLTGAVDPKVAENGTIDLKELALPGVTLKDVKGKIVLQGNQLRISLVD